MAAISSSYTKCLEWKATFISQFGYLLSAVSLLLFVAPVSGFASDLPCEGSPGASGVVSSDQEAELEAWDDSLKEFEAALGEYRQEISETPHQKPLETLSYSIPEVKQEGMKLSAHSGAPSAPLSYQDGISALPNHFARQGQALFSDWSDEKVGWLAYSLGNFGNALEHDQENRRYYLEHHPLSEGQSHLGNDYLGRAEYHIAGAGLAYLGGRIFENEKLGNLGSAWMEALIWDGAVTGGLKAGFNRDRPTGRGMSFPSGHTSTMATTAAVFSVMSDWHPAVVIPSYLATSLVGVARMQEDDHWLSDVVGGAVIGTLIGVSVAKQYLDDEYEEEERNFYILPYTGQGNNPGESVFGFYFLYPLKVDVPTKPGKGWE